MHKLELVGGTVRLDDNAACLLVLHLGYQVLVVLHVLHHHVVVGEIRLVLRVAGGVAAGQGADCVVLRSVRGRQRVVPRVGLHLGLVLLVVLVNERLLLALLLQLLVGLLLVVGCREAHGGSTGVVVVVAEIDLHIRLLLLHLCLVHIRGTGQDVDLLEETRVVVEVIIQAAVPALAALVRLLSVVARLVEVVLINETRTGVDDLAARAGNCVAACHNLLLAPRLPLIKIVHLQLRLSLRVDGRLLHAGGPLVDLHLVVLSRCLSVLYVLLLEIHILI